MNTLKDHFVDSFKVFLFRHVTQDTPPKVTYFMTEVGKSILPIGEKSELRNCMEILPLRNVSVKQSRNKNSRHNI